MVSKASELLPEPERPVNTTSASRGISRATFLRLCSRAPRTWMVFISSEPGRTGDFLGGLLMGDDLARRPGGGNATQRRGAKKGRGRRDMGRPRADFSLRGAGRAASRVSEPR